MRAQISAICTNDFFQERASQSLQEKESHSVPYFSSYSRTTYSIIPDSSTQLNILPEQLISGHHECPCTTFSLFHPFLQDPEAVAVALAFHSYPAVPMWIGLVRSVVHIVNAGTGSLWGKRLSCWTPEWIKPDLPFPLRQSPHSCADIATTDLNSSITKHLWTNKKGHLYANICWSTCLKYTQLWF